MHSVHVLSMAMLLLDETPLTFTPWKFPNPFYKVLDLCVHLDDPQEPQTHRVQKSLPTVHLREPHPPLVARPGPACSPASLSPHTSPRGLWSCLTDARRPTLLCSPCPASGQVFINPPRPNFPPRQVLEGREYFVLIPVSSGHGSQQSCSKIKPRG